MNREKRLASQRRYRERNRERRNAEKREWAKRNREHVRAYNAAWKSNQPPRYWMRWPSHSPERTKLVREKIKARFPNKYRVEARLRYLKNPERMREISRRNHQRHKLERNAAHRLHYQRNKAAYAQYAKLWKLLNAEHYRAYQSDLKRHYTDKLLPPYLKQAVKAYPDPSIPLNIVKLQIQLCRNQRTLKMMAAAPLLSQPKP